MTLRSTFWLALLAGLVCPVTAADDHVQYRLGYALIAHEDMQEFFYTGPVIGKYHITTDSNTHDFWTVGVGIKW